MTGRRAIGLTPVILPVAIIGAWIVVGVFATWLMPKDPLIGNLRASLLPPMWITGGSGEYPLGTDLHGRDILSELIMGARLTLIVAFGAVSIGAVTGTLTGLIVGYFGGWTDAILMRIADFVLAFPVLLGALLLAITIGPSFAMVVAIIGLVLWPRFARIVRSEVLSLRNREFVAAAVVSGASPRRILLRHLLPNVLNTVIVMATLQIGQSILAEASLSFLGVGVPPPNPSWGAMINAGRDYLQSAWWLSVIPGIAILGVVLAVNLTGDAIRDAFDPRLRRR